MSRLIDADALLNKLNELGWLDDTLLEDIINEQPTVYDVDIVEEREQYRAIGTIEEFKDLKEKSVAKKIINIQINKMQSFCEDDFGRNMPCIVNVFQFKCPNCNKKIASRFKIRKCPDCEQKLDWQ